MNFGAEKANGSGGAVKTKVRGWLHEMRKKSHVTVQKWVDSISTANNEEQPPTDDVLKGQNKHSSCDTSELNVESSTSGGAEATSVKGKITELCNKLNVNEKLKSKKIQEFKNLLAKKVNKKEDAKMEDNQVQQHQENEDEEEEEIEDENKEKEDEEKEIVDTLNTQRCRIGVLGRSCSENPTLRNRRLLNDIGRSFSVAHDDLQLPPNDSSENLIYDEDTSNTIPTSPSVMSNKTNSNSQLDRHFLGGLRPPGHMRSVREHTVSEGHYSPLPKNQLLRDSSFQSDESHCSSVENLLEARKPDAEAILINLGFGPTQGSDDLLAKIPKRFLKPSEVKGVDTDTFVKNQQLAMNIHESSVLGYRGLLGNSHVPSDIVKAIIHRFSQNELQRMNSMDNISSQRSFRGIANTILAHRNFMK